MKSFIYNRVYNLSAWTEPLCT